MIGSRRPSEHKNTRADDCADTQRNQVAGTERALQAVLARFRGFRHDHGQWFFGHHISHSVLLVSSYLACAAVQTALADVF